MHAHRCELSALAGTGAVESRGSCVAPLPRLSPASCLRLRAGRVVCDPIEARIGPPAHSQAHRQVDFEEQCHVRSKRVNIASVLNSSVEESLSRSRLRASALARARRTSARGTRSRREWRVSARRAAIRRSASLSVAHTSHLCPHTCPVRDNDIAPRPIVWGSASLGLVARPLASLRRPLAPASASSSSHCPHILLVPRARPLLCCLTRAIIRADAPLPTSEPPRRPRRPPHSNGAPLSAV